MADDNKPIKYLRYAIGEIVLVVIGILIAIQLNNWAEHRKVRLLEKEYLIALKTEFATNQNGAGASLTYQEYLISNAELILKSCQQDTILPNAEYLVVAIEHVGWTYSISHIRDVWTELNSTGNLRIISDKSLRKSLTEFYRTMDGYFIEEKECASFNAGIRRILGEVLNPNLRLDINKKLNPHEYAGGVTNLPDQQLLIERLNQLQGVKGYLVDIIEGRKTTMGWLRWEISQMDTVLMALDNELNKN